MVESVLDLAKEAYAEKANVHQTEIIVDNIYLPSAPSSNDPHALSWYTLIIYLIHICMYH